MCSPMACLSRACAVHACILGNGCCVIYSDYVLGRHIFIVYRPVVLGIRRRNDDICQVVRQIPQAAGLQMIFYTEKLKFTILKVRGSHVCHEIYISYVTMKMKYFIPWYTKYSCMGLSECEEMFSCRQLKFSDWTI